MRCGCGKVGPRATGTGAAIIRFQKEPLNVILHNANLGLGKRFGDNRVALGVVCV